MAKLVEDAVTVQKWVEEKQQLEVMLAWDLLERFNTHKKLIGDLRLMAQYAVLDMSRMPRDSVDKAILEESGRPNMQYLNNQIVRSRVLKVHSQADLQLAWKHNPLPDAQYCSDIIRLYGTCIEQAKKDGYPVYVILNEQREKNYRLGGLDVWNKGADEKNKEKQLDWGRHRNIGASFAPEASATDVGLVSPEDRKKPESMGDVGQFQIEDSMISKVHRFLIYQQGGQAGIELKDSSTVGKIDRVYGTVPAADISGTTTDTLFFFDQFKKFLPGGAMDPIFYLLPAATIVAMAHHSILEVAWSLSLNSKIDYHIGYYKTLMPNRMGLPDSAGATEIKKSLEAAENHNYNHRMLIFYNGPNNYAGCFKFENPLELEIFKTRFSKINDVATRFQKLPAWPTKRDIQNTWTGVFS